VAVNTARTRVITEIPEYRKNPRHLPLGLVMRGYNKTRIASGKLNTEMIVAKRDKPFILCHFPFTQAGSNYVIRDA